MKNSSVTVGALYPRLPHVAMRLGLYHHPFYGMSGARGPIIVGTHGLVSRGSAEPLSSAASYGIASCEGSPVSPDTYPVAHAAGAQILRVGHGHVLNVLTARRRTERTISSPLLASGAHGASILSSGPSLYTFRATGPGGAACAAWLGIFSAIDSRVYSWRPRQKRSRSVLSASPSTLVPGSHR